MSTQPKQSSKAEHDLPAYSPPQGLPYAYLPSSFIPYGELMRISKPVGTLNIYFPYLFGTVYACLVSPSLPPLSELLRINSILFVACFLLRSLGCCWNDIIDRDLDRKVSRCRLRPMARGAISPRNAYIFTTAQTLLWLWNLSLISRDCVTYSIPLTFLVTFYPFSKRLSNFPQVVLGVTLSWGVLVGSLAMGIDPLSLILSSDSIFSTGTGLVGLYLIYTLWTVTHDLIYAFQDFEDDLKAGILSMAVLFRNHTSSLLWSLAAGQIGLLLMVGAILGASPIFFFFAVGGNIALMVAMIRQVNLGDPKACFWWFNTGCLIFGTTTFAGLFGEYLNRIWSF